MRYVLTGLVLVVCGGCDFIGGAETLIRGSNNLLVQDGDADVVAKALSEFENVPAVTDDELRAIYSTIQSAAMEGDLASVRVMLRLASIQRAPEEAEEETDD